MTTEKGGRLAAQAGMLCGDPGFRLYLDQRRRWRDSLTQAQLPDGTHTAQDAADAIRQACGVKSRAELDHDEMAATMFRRIVSDFGRWKRRTG
ncbi:MAG: hypothetical protein ACOC0M_00185 [Halomonas sp.]